MKKIFILLIFSFITVFTINTESVFAVPTAINAIDDGGGGGGGGGNCTYNVDYYYYDQIKRWESTSPTYGVYDLVTEYKTKTTYSSCTVNWSPMRYRVDANDVQINWSDVPSSEKVTMSYNTLAFSGDVDTVLYYGDVIVMGGNTYNVAISRDRHYDRNDNQMSFPTMESDFISNYVNNSAYDCELMQGPLWNLIDAAYFHKINPLIGSSNWYGNNSKYTCKVQHESHEVVYNGYGQKVSDPLVYGTYNYWDADNNRELHWMLDVIPYLIWGNIDNDGTTTTERFMYDKDANVGIGDLYNLRGSALAQNFYTLYGNNFSGDITSSDISAIINLTSNPYFTD